MGWWFGAGSRGRSRLRIEATPVSTDNVRRLVSRLRDRGHPDALDTASLIARAHEREVYGVRLQPRQRDAVLAVLAEQQDDLGDLRRELLREAAERP